MCTATLRQLIDTVCIVLTSVQCLHHCDWLRLQHNTATRCEMTDVAAVDQLGICCRSSVGLTVPLCHSVNYPRIFAHCCLMVHLTGPARHSNGFVTNYQQFVLSCHLVVCENLIIQKQLCLHLKLLFLHCNV